MPRSPAISIRLPPENILTAWGRSWTRDNSGGAVSALAGFPGRGRVRATGGRTRRQALIGCFLILVAAWAIHYRRNQCIEGLPDVGDPFDITQFKARLIVPDSENAFEAYLRACSALSPAAVIYGRDPARPVKADGQGADPATKELLEENERAISHWVVGVSRPRAVCFSPGEIGFEREEKFSEVAFGLRSLSALAAPQGDSTGMRRKTRRGMVLAPRAPAIEPASRDARPADRAIHRRRAPHGGLHSNRTMGGRSPGSGVISQASPRRDPRDPTDDGKEFRGDQGRVSYDHALAGGCERMDQEIQRSGRSLVSARVGRRVSPQRTRAQSASCANPDRQPPRSSR